MYKLGQPEPGNDINILILRRP